MKNNPPQRKENLTFVDGLRRPPTESKDSSVESQRNHEWDYVPALGPVPVHLHRYCKSQGPRKKISVWIYFLATMVVYFDMVCELVTILLSKV